jgi:hypothetical protein
MKINLNTVLLVLAGLGVFAPDIASVAGWLAAMHVAWLGTVVKGLGLLAAFCSAAPLVVPRLRAFLALLGLATPPGAVAPWDPKRDAGPGAAPRATVTTSVVDLPAARKTDWTTPGMPVILALIVGLSLLPSLARAQSYGGCFADGKLCAGPSAAITVVSFNLADSTFTGGVSPGVGYGLTFTPPSAPWANVGLDLYASIRLGQSLPNNATFSLMGHFANYLFVGIGPTITQEPAGQSALVQWSILGGFGVPIELSAYKARSTN